MYSFLASAVAGASLFGGVLSAPALNVDSYKSVNSYSASSAASTAFPLADGFPEPNDKQLRIIEELAHGTLPDGSPPPPGSISAEGITNLQFIEFNENIESAFFASMLFNITTNVPGFVISDKEERNFVLEVLIAVLAQEELHALNAANGLKSQGLQPILPCKYVFPTETFDDAVALAALFTDVVLGTLQDVIEIFAKNNDTGLTRGVASVVGQEGEQEGFFRILQNKNKIPNELPFLTTSTREFAFSALQAFVVPGSCPNADLIKLNTFGPLNVLTKVVEPKDQLLTFSFDLKTLNNSNVSKSHGGSSSAPSSTLSTSRSSYSPTGASNAYSSSTSTAASSASSTYTPTAAVSSYSGYQTAAPSHPSKRSDSYSAYGTNYDSHYDWTQAVVVFINQQNTPKTERLQNVKIDGTIITFQAQFNFQKNLLNGLTIAAVAVDKKGGFASANEVADATLFGPGLIEVN